MSEQGDSKTAKPDNVTIGVIPVSVSETPTNVATSTSASPEESAKVTYNTAIADKLTTAANHSSSTAPSAEPGTLTSSNSSSGVFKVPKQILVSDALRSNDVPSTTVSANNSNGSGLAVNGSSINTHPSNVVGVPNNGISQNIAVTNGGVPVPAAANSSAILNKNIISNLNKSLKAKQKIINSKEPHPKNTSLISDIMNTSPQASAFPNNVSSNDDSNANLNNPATMLPSNSINTTAANAAETINTIINTNNNSQTNPIFLHQNSSSQNVDEPSILSGPNANTNVNINNQPGPNIGTNATSSNGAASTTINLNNNSGNLTSSTNPANSAKTRKHKKISKQSSTKTDFFAAKLASAVDDVDSSDSDETFVYENNNVNDFDTLSQAANVQDASSIHGSVMGISHDQSSMISPPAASAGQQFQFQQQLGTNSAGGNIAHTNAAPGANTVPGAANAAVAVNSDTTSLSAAPAAPSIAGISNTPLSHSPQDETNPEAILTGGFLAASARLFKNNSYNSTPVPAAPGSNNSRDQHHRPPSVAGSFNSNHYLENLANGGGGSNREKRLNTQRSFSSYTFSQDEQQNPRVNLSSERSFQSPNQYIDNTQSTPSQLQGNPQNNAHGLGIMDSTSRNFNAGSQRAQSINDNYTEDHYSYDEIDDDEEDEEDDVSTDGEFQSNGNPRRNNPQNQTLLQNQPNSRQNIQQNDNQGANVPSVTTHSVASKSTSRKNYKSSNSSSKLRSTTSKLFDKIGSQPRRYSIIPDDIDIEDFDDELIYYDNNIRFPYNTVNNPGAQNTESSPLINHGHRLPHYRSLNLNFPGAKRPSALKNKRYLSTGQPMSPNHNSGIPGRENGMPNVNAAAAAAAAAALTNGQQPVNGEMYGYPMHDQAGTYYYDFDDFDEESQMDEAGGPGLGSGDDHELNQLHRNAVRKLTNGSTRYLQHHPSNQFFLSHDSKSPLGQRRSNQRVNCIKSFIYTLISITCILGIGFVMGFVLATTKDLTNVSITSIENPLVSLDELVFNIVVEALNPGWFTVNIEDVELDIFAKSGYLPDEGNSFDEDKSEGRIATSTVETVLLGTVYNLESPMSFEGGFFKRDAIRQLGDIKLLSPGKNLTGVSGGKGDNSTDPDNSKKWELISKNPFDLIIRGILKYNLPMSKVSKSIVVNKVGYIDPSSNVYLRDA